MWRFSECHANTRSHWLDVRKHCPKLIDARAFVRDTAVGGFPNRHVGQESARQQRRRVSDCRQPSVRLSQASIALANAREVTRLNHWIRSRYDQSIWFVEKTTTTTSPLTLASSTLLSPPQLPPYPPPHPPVHHPTTNNRCLHMYRAFEWRIHVVMYFCSAQAMKS